MYCPMNHKLHSGSLPPSVPPNPPKIGFVPQNDLQPPPAQRAPLICQTNPVPISDTSPGPNQPNHARQTIISPTPDLQRLLEISTHVLISNAIPAWQLDCSPLHLLKYYLRAFALCAEERTAIRVTSRY